MTRRERIIALPASRAPSVVALTNAAGELVSRVHCCAACNAELAERDTAFFPDGTEACIACATVWLENVPDPDEGSMATDEEFRRDDPRWPR